MIPTKIFFTKGIGRHKEKLASFELALRDAGIAPFNLVNVSSIFPPGCKIISKDKGLMELKPGQIVFVVLARNETDEANRLVATSVGCAIPSDPNVHGYLSEHHSFGEPDDKAGDYAEDLAAQMLATTLGIEFDSDANYDEMREIWQIDGRIVRTMNITQSAIGKDGVWTSVVAAAVLIGDDKKELKPDTKENNKE